MSSLVDGMLDLLLGNKTLTLKITAWEQSIHGVNKSSVGDFPMGEHRIDLDCVLPSAVMAGELLVGTGPTESLNGLRFTIKLCGARKIFAGIAAETETEVSKNATGALVYHPPIAPEGLAGLSTDIIERAKTGSITGWGLFDDDTLWKISQLLATHPVGQVELWVTVRATRAPTVGAMTYETQMYPPIYRWTGKEGLAIWDVAVVTRSRKKADPDPGFEETPENEIVVAIREVRELITSTALKIGVCLAVMLGAILIELWRFH